MKVFYNIYILVQCKAYNLASVCTGKLYKNNVEIVARKSGDNLERFFEKCTRGVGTFEIS